MSKNLCQKCGKNTAALPALINNQVVALCLVCYEEAFSKPAEQAIFSFLDALAGVASPPLQETPAQEPCPKCGLRWEDFLKEQRLGCPFDYQHFSQSLNPVIAKVHGSIQHRGKVPLSAINLEDARNSLQKAIKEERYEDAAKWRDLLKKIDTKL